MSATYDWQEDNGAATGSPAKGTTRTTGRTEVNWKNIDDSTTAYSSSPITAGNNSYQKNQFGKFTGTFNQIGGSGLFAHTSTAFGSNLTLKGVLAATAFLSFTVTSASATVGATYTNNGVTYTVLATIASATTLTLSSGSTTTAPQASGTLTKASGTGDATITFSAYYNSYVYVTPSTTADTNLGTDMTSAIAIGSGVAVWYGATGPEAATKAPTSTNATTYSNWLTTQLQTAVGAAAGDTATVVVSHSYSEN